MGQANAVGPTSMEGSFSSQYHVAFYTCLKTPHALQTRGCESANLSKKNSQFFVDSYPLTFIALQCTVRLCLTLYRMRSYRAAQKII